MTEGRLNYSLTPRDGYCEVYARSEKNNFYGTSTLLRTSRGQHNLAPDNLAVSSFSRKCNSVKTKVVKLCEMYQFERVNHKVVRNLLKDRSEQAAGKLLQWTSCWRKRERLCWWQVPFQTFPCCIPSLLAASLAKCQMNVLTWLFCNTGLENLWQGWGQHQAVGSRNLLKW